MTLKELRINYEITQLEASDVVGAPLRTYIRYENDESYGSSLKRGMMIKLLNDKYEKTKKKGILTIERIKRVVREVVLAKYKDEINLVILFGSYSRGKARDISDVDLCISTELTGIEFLQMVENFRQALHKKVDVLRIKDLKSEKIIFEIMKDRIKLYDKEEEEELSE